MNRYELNADWEDYDSYESDADWEDITPGGAVDDEPGFQDWYGKWSKTAGIDPDPDDPRHKYDYRSAYRAGVEPSMAGDGKYHWPSKFKADDHPNRFVGGVDTRTGEGPGGWIQAAKGLAAAPKIIPQQIAAKGLQLIRGGDIDTTQGWSDKFIKEAGTDLQEYIKEYGGPEDDPSSFLGIKPRHVAESVGNIAYSGISMGAGLATGGATMLATRGRGGKLAYLTGGAASGASAYRMAKDEIMQSYFDSVNEEAMERAGRPLNEEEWQQAKEMFESQATQYGLWEAVPEALGNVVGFRLLTAPLKKLVGQKIASKMAGKLSGSFLGKAAGVTGRGAGILASEEIQEATTTAGLPMAESGGAWKGQAGIEARAGLREKDLTWTEGLKEVWGPTAVTTGILGPFAKVAHSGFGKIRGLASDEKDILSSGEGLLTREESQRAKYLDQLTTGIDSGEIDIDHVQALREKLDDADPLAQMLDDVFLQPSQFGPDPTHADPQTADFEARLRNQATINKTMREQAEAEEAQAVVAEQIEAQAEWEDIAPGQAGLYVEPSQAPDLGTPVDMSKFEQAPQKGLMTPEQLEEARGRVRYEKGMQVEPSQVPDRATAVDMSGFDREAHEAATSPLNDLPEPTEAQKEAGNYKKAHVSVQGFDISIENPKGSTRTGTAPDGTEWETEMTHHYGYFKRSEGKDGDQIDVFVGPNPESETAYIVDQIAPETGKFDEHKVLMGFDSLEDAEEGYLSNYEEGWQGIGNITEVPIDELKKFVEGGKQTKPYTPFEIEERRQDIEKRKRIDEMTSEEMQKELKTDFLTGLGNKRALHEAKPKPVMSSIDMDSLGYVNDTYGHDAGDAALKLMGDALKNTDAVRDTYHISGDEFVIQGETEKEVDAAIQRAYEYLKKNPLEIEHEDGSVDVIPISFSYGKGETYETADKRLLVHKKAREARGERSPSKVEPPGIFKKPARGVETEDRGEGVPEAEIIPYSKDLDIRNTENLPKGVGARYLEVVAGEGSEYIAKQWRRKPTKKGILIDFEADKEAAPPTEKPYKKPRERAVKGAGVRTLRGRIRAMGKINPINFTGEVKELPLEARYLFKKDGIGVDVAEEILKSEGWLDENETLFEVLRDKENLKRDNLKRDMEEKKPHELAPEEKRIKEEMEHEPEAPPEGEYVQVKAEDLPEGKEMTIIEGDSVDGWDVYEVTDKDEFGITLKDGTTIELAPLDTVEVLKSDIEETDIIPPTGEVAQEVDIFGKALPGQQEMFDIPKGPKPEKKKRVKKEKLEKSQTQLDLFTGEGEQIQVQLFDTFAKGEKPKLEEVKPGSMPVEHQRTRMQTTGHIKAAGNLARNVDEAASLLSHIRKSAQEDIFGVTVDKNGVVLEIHRYGKGTMGAVKVSVVEFAGHVLNTPDAAFFFFAHNHPGGSVSPSTHDLAMAEEIENLLALKDIKTHALIIAGNEYFEFTGTNALLGGKKEINPILRKVDLPVKERVYDRRKLGPVISDSEKAKARFKDEYGNAEGFIFLNAGLNEVGFLPFVSGGMMKDMTTAIISQAERVNATGFIFNSTKPFMANRGRVDYFKNLATVLDNSLQIFDISDQGKSLADDGTMNNFRGPSSWEAIKSEVPLFSIKEKTEKEAITLSREEVEALRKAKPDTLKTIEGRGHRNKITRMFKSKGFKNPDAFRVVKPETDEQKQIVKIAKELGLKAVFFDTLDPQIGVNGVIDAKAPNVVYLNTKPKNKSVLMVAGHEVLHTLKAKHPEVYEFLKSALIKNKAIGFDEYLKRINEQRAKVLPDYKPMKAEEVFDEFMADFAGEQWADPEFWKILASENPTLAQKVMEIVREVLDKIMSYLTDNNLKGKYFEDIKAAQKNLAVAMKEYAEREGIEVTIPDKALTEEMPLFQIGDTKTQAQKADEWAEKFFKKYTEGKAPPKIRRLKKAAKKISEDDISWEGIGFDWSSKGLKNSAVKLYTKFIMQEYPIARLASKAGKEEAKRIEHQIRRIRGKGGISETILTSPQSLKALADSGITEYKDIKKSLKDVLSPLSSREEYQDYERLRVAERDLAFAKYRPDIKGVDADRAELIVGMIEDKYGDGIKKLREVSREHREFERQAILQPLVNSGWMSQEQYDAIVNRPESEYYASFLREMEDVDRQIVGGGKDPVKRIYGSEKKKIPSVEGTISNLQRTVKLIETLRLNKQVVELSDLSAELGEMIQEKSPWYKTVKGDYGVYESGVSTDRAMRVFDTEIEAEIFSAFTPGTMVVKRPNQSIRIPIQPRGTIVVAENGIKKYYTVPEDVHKALDYYTPEEVSTVIKIMSIPTRLLRAGATLSAEFIMRNPVRDQLSAFVYSKYGYNPFIDFGKGMFHLLGKTDLYNEYKAAGSEQSYFVSLDRQSTNVTARNLTGYKKKGLERFSTLNPVEALRILSEWMEKGTRIGLYARAKTKGATTLEAMSEAREGTLDFGRIGSEKSLNQIIAFWNANLQGTDKMRRSFMDNPGRTALRAVLGITVPSIILWFLNHDDDRYKDLPEWQKNFFWIIPVGDDGPIIRIPKPFELGIIFGSLPERILDYIYDNDPDDLKSIGKAITDGAMPGLVPTAALPIIEHITNYSFFRERKLESMGIQRLPKRMRYTPYTTKTAKGIGEVVNISPIKLENWVRDWGGTLTMESMRYMDVFLKDPEVKRVGKKWYEATPGLKGFIAREPIGSASKNVEDFYRALQKVTEKEAGYKTLLKSDSEEAREYFNKNQAEIQLAPTGRKISKILSLHRKQINRITNSKDLDSDEKRRRIDVINRKITEKARQFDQLYDKKKKVGSRIIKYAREYVDIRNKGGNLTSLKKTVKEYNERQEDLDDGVKIPWLKIVRKGNRLRRAERANIK